MISRRLALGCALALPLLSAGPADATDRAALDALIAKHAKENGVPESLVHRVVRRESNYNPRAAHRGNYGLMQIRHGTARGMGYAGSAAGLLDADTNLSYAVPYLANAYRVAGGDQNRAVSLYSSGFYYVAKRRGLLGALKKGPIGDPAEIAQAQPDPTFGSWLAAAFAPPQAQAQPAVVAQAAEEPAAPASKRQSRRERIAARAAKAEAALAKAEASAQAVPAQEAKAEAAAAQDAAAPEPKAEKTATREATRRKGATQKIGNRMESPAETVVLRRTEEPAEAAPTPPRREAKLDAKAEAKPTKPAPIRVARADGRAKDAPAQGGLKLPPDLATRR
jgi:chemotaxis protein histidine kinase CheA